MLILKIPLINNENGHTLIEILAVSAIIGILATIPISYLKEAKIRANETAALGALNQMAAAYEDYRVVGPTIGMYPHFFSNGEINDFATFRNAEEIWDELIEQGLLPSKYRGFSHNEPNLLAPGYIFSIYPVNYGTFSFYSVNPWDSYVFALIPMAGTSQPRTLAVLHGEHFGKYYTNARAHKSTSRSGDLTNIQIFTFADPE